MTQKQSAKNTRKGKFTTSGPEVSDDCDDQNTDEHERTVKGIKVVIRNFETEHAIVR